MLSERAKRFLKTLERRPSVPTKVAEAIIQDQGYPCFEPWLNFHENYAGYLERFGRDGAIWGLVHENPQWLLPLTADIDREPHEEVWYITCADVHPSYNYRLDNKGEFLGAPAESFDIHVERIALGWELSHDGPNRVLTFDELCSSEMQETFLVEIKAYLVPEASDKFSRYYRTETYFVVEDAEDGILRDGRKHVIK